MHITTITIEDIHHIAPLFNDYRIFYGQESNVQAAEQFLVERAKHNESIIFAAVHNDQYVGFTQLYPTFSSVAMKKAYILNDLYVHESCRRMGIAEQLMDTAFRYAQNNDARFITLETGTKNEKAQALYEKVGMTHEDNVKHYSLYW